MIRTLLGHLRALLARPGAEPTPAPAPTDLQPEPTPEQIYAARAAALSASPDAALMEAGQESDLVGWHVFLNVVRADGAPWPQPVILGRLDEVSAAAGYLIARETFDMLRLHAPIAARRGARDPGAALDQACAALYWLMVDAGITAPVLVQQTRVYPITVADARARAHGGRPLRLLPAQP